MPKWFIFQQGSWWESLNIKMEEILLRDKGDWGGQGMKGWVGGQGFLGVLCRRDLGRCCAEDSLDNTWEWACRCAHTEVSLYLCLWKPLCTYEWTGMCTCVYKCSYTLASTCNMADYSQDCFFLLWFPCFNSSNGEHGLPWEDSSLHLQPFYAMWPLKKAPPKNRIFRNLDSIRLMASLCDSQRKLCVFQTIKQVRGQTDWGWVWNPKILGLRTTSPYFHGVQMFPHFPEKLATLLEAPWAL